jgi:predicted dehydrogenase
MTTPSAESPVRIGLVGLGPSGAYHLERLAFREDLHVVIASDEHADPARRHARDPNVLSQVGDLLGRSDIDWVLIAAPLAERAKLTLRALEAGKNVAVESPPCVDAVQLQAMTAAAREARRALTILPSRREAVDFRAAHQTVAAGTLGSIEAARIVCWAKAVPADAANLTMSRGMPEAAPGDGVFSFFAYQYVDQLLQLVRQQAKSVFARIHHPPQTDPTATAFFVTVAFASSDALIDVNLHAGAALQTGWILAGSAGSYCQQKTYLTEPSGEVCDTPIPAADVLPLDIYAELVQSSHPGSSHPDSSHPREPRLESAAEALSVLRIIDAARRSARIGQVVELGD